MYTLLMEELKSERKKLIEKVHKIYYKKIKPNTSKFVNQSKKKWRRMKLKKHKAKLYKEKCEEKMSKKKK